MTNRLDNLVADRSALENLRACIDLLGSRLLRLTDEDRSQLREAHATLVRTLTAVETRAAKSLAEARRAGYTHVACLRTEAGLVRGYTYTSFDQALRACHQLGQHHNLHSWIEPLEDFFARADREGP